MMKKLLVCLSLFLGATVLVADNTMPTKSTGIDSLVMQIKSAKSSDRRLLMNQLKVQLRGMNQETRRKTMMSLRKSFAQHGGQGVHKNRPMNCDKNGAIHERQGLQKHKNRPNHNGEQKGR